MIGFSLILAVYLVVLIPVFAGAKNFRVAREPAWVQPFPAEHTPPKLKDDMTDAVSYLLIDEQVNTQTREYYSHYTRRIETEAGLQAGAQIDLTYDPSYERLTVHQINVYRKGAKLNKLVPSSFKTIQRETNLERQLYDGRLTVLAFLEDVRVGDVIEYAFTLTGGNPIFEGMYAYRFGMEWSSPVARERYRVLVSETKAVYLDSSSYQPTISVRDGMREYVWEAKDIPAKRYEGDVPTWYTPYGSVQLSEYASWEEVARWAMRLYVFPSSLPTAMQRKVDEWKLKSKSSAQRASAALRFVQDDVRYLGIEMGTSSHKPSSPEKVFMRRFGDCKDKSFLLCTLLRAMGIEAHPVLVNSFKRQAVDEFLPSPFAFNHVIAQARVDGKLFWVDPTLSHQRGELDSLFVPAYGKGLVVREGTSALTEIPAQPNDKVLTRIEEYFESEEFTKPAELLVITKYYRQRAEEARAQLADVNRHELEQRYLNFYGESYPGIEARSPIKVEDDESRNVVTVTEYYRIPRFWELSGDSVRYKAEFYAKDMRNYLVKPGGTSRTMPYAIPYPAYVQQVIDIRLPEDWTVNTEADQVRDSSFEFDYSLKGARDRYVMAYEYRSLHDAVPSENVPTYAMNVTHSIEQLGYTFSIPKSSIGKKEGFATLDDTVWLLVLLGIAFVILGAVAILAIILHVTDSRKKFSVREILRNSKRVLPYNLVPVIVPVIVLVGANVLQNFAVPKDFVAQAVTLLVMLPLSAFVSLILLRASLESCAEQRCSLQELLPTHSQFFAYLVGSILTSLLTVLGILFFIVPGLFIGIRCQLFGMFIVDQEFGAWDSIRASYRLTRRAEASLFVLAMVQGVCILLGVLMLGVGLIIAYPFTMLCSAYAYHYLRQRGEVAPGVPLASLALPDARVQQSNVSPSTAASGFPPLPSTATCFACDSTLELTNEECVARSFVCPICGATSDYRESNSINESPEKLAKLLKFVRCPNCQADLELAKVEQAEGKFNCPACSFKYNVVEEEEAQKEFVQQFNVNAAMRCGNCGGETRLSHKERLLPNFTCAQCATVNRTR